MFTSDDGDTDAKCPTEIGITDRREFELSNLGFLPLCHYKNTDYAVFFGAQTAQKPKKYDRPEATANAAISARLPYIMATSRFAHYLKVMARDKIGSFMEAERLRELAEPLDQQLRQRQRERRPGDEGADIPLREARVEVQEIPGKPGSYNAVAYLRPWLQMEELTTSLRMVARIPAEGLIAGTAPTPSGRARRSTRSTPPTAPPARTRRRARRRRAPLRDAVLSGRLLRRRDTRDGGSALAAFLRGDAEAMRCDVVRRRRVRRLAQRPGRPARRARPRHRGDRRAARREQLDAILHHAAAAPAGRHAGAASPGWSTASSPATG